MPAPTNWATGGVFAAADENVLAAVANAYVRCATVGTEAFTISAGSVTTIAGTTIDGVAVAVGDPILIKDAPAASGAGSVRSSQPANGIYVVTAVGTNISISRAAHMAASNGGNGTVQNPSGAAVNVMAGTLWAQSDWQVSSPASPTASFTYGTTAVQWSVMGKISLWNTYANRPPAGYTGLLYLCSDNGNRYRDNGTSWDMVDCGGTGMPGTAPPTTGWTPTSLTSGSSVAASTDGILMTSAAIGSSADQLNFYYRTLSPTSNYTATFFLDNILAYTNGPEFCIGLSDGTKYLTWGVQVQSSNTPVVLVTQWNSATAVSSGPYSVTGAAAAVMQLARWWRIRDNGTNLYFGWSMNGVDWQEPYSQARTSWLTATRIGFGHDTYGSGYTLTSRLRSLAGVS